MKKHATYLSLLLVLGFGSISLNAQDKNNPFKFTVGTNAVDAFPTNAVNPYETGRLLEEYFNVADHWNFVAAPTYVAGSLYIQDGFSFGLRGSLNKISTLGNTPADKTYFSVDGAFQYAILKDTKLDPYLSFGLGRYWMDENASFTVNGGLGLNYWFNDFIGLTYETNYKHTKNINGVAHLQHSFGISIKGGGSDRDGDGVYDGEDACPDVAGLAAFNGCPDSDSDGIPDPEDNCPSAPGLPEFNGCPDTDGDGIIDSKDNCPNEAGSLALGGCPDSDGDGIIDSEDNCPNEAGVPENNGCPAVQKQLDEYAKTILFVNEKAEFLEESFPALDHILAIVQEYPNESFSVSGHADSRGTEKFNQTLSEKRAQAVVDYLVEKGVEANRFKAAGFGESMPVSSNMNNEGRKMNRRVEVVLIKM